MRVEGSRFDVSGAFNYVRLENLPTNAIGPGGLGTGAFYFAATGVQLQLSAVSRRADGCASSSATGTSLTVGRMPFASGGEVSSPAALRSNS